MAQRRLPKPIRIAAHAFLVVVGAVFFTMVFFLVLPLMQQIARPPFTLTEIETADVANIPPPPPPPEEEPPEPEPEEIEPPQLEQDIQPLDLSQLELALNPGMGGGGLTGSFDIDLSGVTAVTGGADELFSLADLDQKPRPINQAAPRINDQMRRELRNGPGQVILIFVVNQRGRVEQAKIQRSSHPVFEAAALDALRQWQFEPGTRQGNPVRFRMRVPITFPAQS